MAMPNRLPSDFTTVHTDVVAANCWVQRIDYFFLRMNKRMNRGDFSLS